MMSTPTRTITWAARWPAIQLEGIVRRIMDISISLSLLLILLPLMLAIAIAIRVESPGPVLFRQQRVGRDRHVFTMLKFRTMHTGGDDRRLRELIIRELMAENTCEHGSTKLDNDTRITRVGAVLRRTSLDELPQLYNVLRGDMALVGPRPCLEWEAEMFPAVFSERYTVRPGITGLWQVSGRSTIGTLDMLQLDVAYVRRRSIWTDINILIRTPPAVLPRGGSR
jgi:lipopolysaccharide/colanic/teichoic acid biosynthesis glycosyltransferase